MKTVTIAWAYRESGAINLSEIVDDINTDDDIDLPAINLVTTENSFGKVITLTAEMEESYDNVSVLQFVNIFVADQNNEIDMNLISVNIDF